MSRTADRPTLRRTHDLRLPLFHQSGSEQEHQSRAERWFESAIGAWEQDGRVTGADAALLRARLAEPQFVAVLPHFGVHLAIGAVLRFPVGSITRVCYVLLQLLVASLRLLTRRTDRRGWRQAFGIHSPLVLGISAMPGIGTFAYLASRPMRTNPLLLRVGVDAVLLKLPWHVYERTGLRWIIARPTAAATLALRERYQPLRLTLPAPAVVLLLGAVACGLLVADLLAQLVNQLGIIEPQTMVWRQLARMLDLGAEASFGTWFQVLALVLLAILLTVVSVARLRAGARDAWHWFILALLALGFSIDEQVKIHDAGDGTEKLREALGLSGPMFYGWVVVGGLSVLAVGLAYRRFLADLPRATRRLFILAAGLYAGGEILLEAVSGWYASVAGSQSDFVYQTITSFEEFFGMAGIVVAIAASLQYLQVHIGEIAMTLHDGITGTEDERNESDANHGYQAASAQATSSV